MKPITPYALTAPGFYGLNLSDSPVDLSPNFALVADNCVIDRSGRVASRKGWIKAHTANSDLGANNIECIGELIQNDGRATTLAAGGGFLFKLDASTLTTLTYGGGGSAPTITANNWKFCQLNGVAIFFQRGYDPLIYDPAVSTTTFRRLSEKSGSAGTISQWNTAISAYGRVWAADTAADKQTLAWSDLLTPHIWSGGTSGTLNLVGIWPMGGDEIVGMAAHNNFLFIFGRKQILIYQGANAPATMTLQDTIVGIGCIARDTIQPTGEDVFFLSDTGIRSLERTIQEKSAPFRNVSKNVYDYVQQVVGLNDLSAIKSVYSAINNFYLMTLPASEITLCFDTRANLQDGSARTTQWNGINPKAFCETKGRKLYIGKAGYIGEHTGYLDDTATYRMRYYTTWIDFGNPIQTSILKKINLTAIGGATQPVVFQWAFDYDTTYRSEIASITGVQLTGQWGFSEWGNVYEWGSGTGVSQVWVNAGGSGKLLQFGFEADIAGVQLSIQKIEIFTKDGKL